MVLHEVSLQEIWTNCLDSTPDTLSVMAELAWAVKLCRHGISISVVSVTLPGTPLERGVYPQSVCILLCTAHFCAKGVHIK